MAARVTLLQNNLFRSFRPRLSQIEFDKAKMCQSMFEVRGLQTQFLPAWRRGPSTLGALGNAWYRPTALCRTTAVVILDNEFRPKDFCLFKVESSLASAFPALKCFQS